MTIPGWRDWAFAVKTLGAALSSPFLAMWIDLPRPTGPSHRSISRVRCSPARPAPRPPTVSPARSWAPSYRDPGAESGQRAGTARPHRRVLGERVPLLLIARSHAAQLHVDPWGLYSGPYRLPRRRRTRRDFRYRGRASRGITLGILCASLVSSIVLPQSVAAAITDRLELWLTDARGWVMDVLGRFRTAKDTQSNRLRLASEAVAFDALATPLRYDISGPERSARGHGHAAPAHADVSAHRVRDFQPDRGVGERARASTCSSNASLRHVRLARFRQRRAGRGGEVARESECGRPGPRPQGGLERSCACEPYRSLTGFHRPAAGHTDAQAAYRRRIPGAGTARFPLHRRGSDHPPPRPRDGAAFRDRRFIAIFRTSVIWIATGWTDGSAAPMMAAVGCCFFAVQDDPARSSPFANSPSSAPSAQGSTCLRFAFGDKFRDARPRSGAGPPSLRRVYGSAADGAHGHGAAVNGATTIAIQNGYTGEFAPFANPAIRGDYRDVGRRLVTRLVRSVAAPGARAACGASIAAASPRKPASVGPRMVWSSPR